MEPGGFGRKGHAPLSLWGALIFPFSWPKHERFARGGGLVPVGGFLHFPIFPAKKRTFAGGSELGQETMDIASLGGVVWNPSQRG